MRTFLKRQVNDFNVFFCFLTNSVFFKQNHVWVKHCLPIKTFYAVTASNLKNSFLLKFFNNKEAFWSFFWKILTFNRALNAAFFVELELIGLGFRIRKISSTVYRFFWGYATFVYLFVPTDVLLEYSQEERTVFFFWY